MSLKALCSAKGFSIVGRVALEESPLVTLVRNIDNLRTTYKLQHTEGAQRLMLACILVYKNPAIASVLSSKGVLVLYSLDRGTLLKLGNALRALGADANIWSSNLIASNDQHALVSKDGNAFDKAVAIMLNSSDIAEFANKKFREIFEYAHSIVGRS